MRYLITIILLFLITSLQAITWSKVYGTVEDDYAHVIKQTPDSGYIVLGHTGTYSNYKSWLIKLDEFGDSIWSIEIDSITSNLLYMGIPNRDFDIEIDYDSGYILAINYGSGGDYDLRIVKTDQNGNIIWSNIYDLYNSFIDYPYDIDKTIDSGYVIIGQTIWGNSETFILKLAQNGDSLWYANTGDESYFTGVCENSEKGYFASSADFYPHPPYILFKYDSLGNCISWESYNNDSWGQDIEMLFDSNYILITFSHLFKINENLDTIWSIEEGGFDVEPCFDSGFVIVYRDNINSFINKFSVEGDSLWTSYFGGSGDDALYSVSRTFDGGYICCGYTDSWGAGGYDFYIIKTDSLGNALGVEEEIIKEELQHYLSIQNIGNKQISIKFSILENQQLELKLHDLMGRLLFTPVSGYFTEGNHNIDLQLESEGLYFYRVKINKRFEAGKFIVF